MEVTFNNLTDIIKKYDKFILMTHKNPDFDGMGSAIALQQIIHSFKKDSYICVNKKEQSDSLLRAYDQISKKGLYHQTIPKSDVLNNVNDETVLIVLDTHKQILLELPEAIDKFNNIIILDHHIKSKNYIKNSILSYINANVSSTVEIIVNYAKHLNKTFDPVISTILLTGLEIDTNHFRLKTTEKTYEAAAFLTRMGADNILKQELLKENKEKYIRRKNLIEKSFMAKENIAFCIAYEEIYESKDLAAIAEELLIFENVEASFVIGKIKENLIGISARSIGNIDVEKIMFQLGGGGHRTEAATQIENIEINKIKDQLLEIIGG